MTVCGQNHSHLQYILRKLSKAKNRFPFLKSFLSNFFKAKQQSTQLPRCPGCAYVMGYKDGLNGTCTNIENVPYREIESNVNTCAEIAYKKGFDDGAKERLYQ